MKKRLQVFISSTYTDLIEERQAAVAAVLKAGHIPAGMELFNAADQSQLEVIKRWINESDIYMVIIGGRYGSVEKTSGVSYTELEYDYARSIQKPLFAVVIKETALNEKAKTHGLQVLEQERQAELKMFKEKVLANMSSFFEDCKDIRLAILESLPDIAATRNLSGWISGRDVPDAKTLVDEITRLTNENTELQVELSELQKTLKSKKPLGENTSFEELKEILTAIQIEVPRDLAEDNNDRIGAGIVEKKLSLFHLFVEMADFFATGSITSRNGQGPHQIFLFQNVSPKLQVHGLVTIEKVANMTWRRAELTQKGRDFLAYLDRKKLLKK